MRTSGDITDPKLTQSLSSASFTKDPPSSHPQEISMTPGHLAKTTNIVDSEPRDNLQQLERGAHFNTASENKRRAWWSNIQPRPIAAGGATTSRAHLPSLKLV